MSHFKPTEIPSTANAFISLLLNFKFLSLFKCFLNFKLGKDYPCPIVDLQKSSKEARDKIWKYMKKKMVKKEKQRILKTHVNTKK